MMKDVLKSLSEVGLALPYILLPNKDIPYEKFAVIACDQFTAQPEYWQAVKEFAGDSPSALNLMLPEAYLSRQTDETVNEINRTMERYVKKGVLCDIGQTFIYLRRRISTGVRRGLVVALDLECYDYNCHSQSLIRATEATIPDRLPPRMKIREGASLEMPHIMVLIDDKRDSLMDMLDDAVDSMPCLYDFTLMLGGGHLAGYRVDSPELLAAVAKILNELKSESCDNFLYAMGDGNHSLAAAKGCWEQIKKGLTEQERESHPARFALVEIVNLYDKALVFEPIHRLLYNVDPDEAQKEIGFDAANAPDAQVLQPKLDEYLKHHPKAKQEYIHGAEECRKLAEGHKDRLAIVFPEFDRDSLFDVVRQNGAFVRKSFSMGQATDKRYYLECHKIK